MSGAREIVVFDGAELAGRGIQIATAFALLIQPTDGEALLLEVADAARVRALLHDLKPQSITWRT
jgi:hypothetical protein